MAQFFNGLSTVFSTFGAAVFVPVILFIIARAMGVSGKRAFNSALLCAVGLTGFNLVIGSYGGIIAPVVNSMDDEYLKARATDINNVCRELMAEIQGVTAGDPFAGVAGRELVIFAEDLTPADTVRLDRSRLAGMVTERGGVTSHTVILAKALGIPAVVGAGSVLNQVRTGDSVLVDGAAGTAAIGADEATIQAFLGKKEKADRQKALFDASRKLPARSRDGVDLRVNINSGDSETIRTFDVDSCDGVGLFRTEFLYMGQTDYPSEDFQFEAYRDMEANCKVSGGTWEVTDDRNSVKGADFIYTDVWYGLYENEMPKDERVRVFHDYQVNRELMSLGSIGCKFMDIAEKKSILNLLDNEYIVIACGGGGIPVVQDENGDFQGVSAVIDKDFASAKLAELVGADYLFILTAVDRVCVNFGKPDQKELISMARLPGLVVVLAQVLQQGAVHKAGCAGFVRLPVKVEVEAAAEYLLAGCGRLIKDMRFSELIQRISVDDSAIILHHTDLFEISEIELIDGTQTEYTNTTLYFGYYEQLSGDGLPAQCVLARTEKSNALTEVSGDLALAEPASLFLLVNSARQRLDADRGRGLYAELLDAAARSAGIDPLVNLAASKLTNSVVLLDTDFKILSHSTLFPIDDPLWAENIRQGYCSYEFVSAVAELDTVRNAPSTSDPVVVTCYASPLRKLSSKIFINGKRVGIVLMLEKETPISSAHMELLPVISAAAGAAIARYAPYLISSSTVYQKLLYDLLIGASPREVGPQIASLAFSPRLCALCIKQTRYLGQKHLKEDVAARLVELLPDTRFTFHDVEAIYNAIQNAFAKKGVPSCIVLDTIKGKGATFAEPKREHSSQPSEEKWTEAIAAAEQALADAKNA